MKISKQQLESLISEALSEAMLSEDAFKLRDIEEIKQKYMRLVDQSLKNNNPESAKFYLAHAIDMAFDIGKATGEQEPGL